MRSNYKSKKTAVIVGAFVTIIIVAIIGAVAINVINKGKGYEMKADKTNNYVSSTTIDATDEDKTQTSDAGETDISDKATTYQNSETNTSKSEETKADKTTEEAGEYELETPVVINIDSEKWYLTLVNKSYALPDGWEPPSLTQIKGGGSATNGKGKMDSRAAEHYGEMYEAAKSDGVTLKVVSAFREYEYQEYLFEKQIKKQMNKGYSEKRAKYEAAKVVTLPGTSDHQLGLGVDIGWTSENFENSPEFKWLMKNAENYGFVLRYPKDKTEVTKVVYEPWHWRYVGAEDAKKMNSLSQCLEEYLGKVK